MPVKFNVAQVWRRKGIATESAFKYLICYGIILLSIGDGDLEVCDKKRWCTHACGKDEASTIVCHVLDRPHVQTLMFSRIAIAVRLVAVDDEVLAAGSPLDREGT